MKTCLITAFEPFGKQTLNASQVVLHMIHMTHKDATIIKEVLPVVFGQSSSITKDLIKAHQPDVLIMLGEAGGRKRIEIERIAINISDAKIEDNIGQKPQNQIIQKEGPDGIFTMLPYEHIIQSLGHRHIDVGLSNSAGTYVCNHLMYEVLYHIKQSHLDKPIYAGFIHLPYIKDQTIDPNIPFLPLSDQKAIIEAIIDLLIEMLD